MFEQDYMKELDLLTEIAQRMRERNERQIAELEQELEVLDRLLHRSEDHADV